MAHPQAARGLIVSVILASLFCCSNLRADAALLPGHNANLEETAKNCYGALVATFEKVEGTVPGPTNVADYTLHWKVKQVLRGDYAPETNLTIMVGDSPQTHESLPVVNKTYILIGYGPDIDHNQMAIVLENTPENLEKVKRLLQR